MGGHLGDWARLLWRRRRPAPRHVLRSDDTKRISSQEDPFEQHTPVRMLDRRTSGILWGESGAWMLNSYD